MKAILVGTFDGNKVYYDIEAKSGEKDGSIVRGDGSTVKIHFFSWASKAQDLKKIRNTKFHRSLWDAPKDPTKGKWFETFIKKEKEFDETILEGVPTLSTIGETKMKIEKKNARAIDFINNKSLIKMVDYKVANPENRREENNEFRI
jgi:hypothetical protein